MAWKEIRPWTLCGLIGAFIDLSLAYFVLCSSSFFFFPSKFLSIFGLRLPCPCKGFLGYQNGNICWNRLLIDWPIRKIHAVQLLAKTRFPFDLVWFRDVKCGNGVVELGGDGSSSSFSGSRNQNLVDRESGCEYKGKRAVTFKQRSGIRRRRRRANLAYGKLASVLSYGNFREMKDRYAEILGPLSRREDGPQDVITASNGNYKGEGTCHGFELSGSFGESNDAYKNSVWFENYIDDAGKKKSIVGSEFDKIRMLERALEEEKAASAALYVELEKERAAAAIAADEAMAMISRLQKDKGSMETETRQYQRMIEEKFAYDEEEIEILKEILIRRERENHFLEKEIEIYRRMSNTGDNQSKGNISDTLDDSEQRPLSSFSSSAGPEMVMDKAVAAKSHYDQDMESNADSPSSLEVPYVEKESHSNGHDLIKERVLEEDHSDGSHDVDEK